jgi:hypothetical protein
VGAGASAGAWDDTAGSLITTVVTGEGVPDPPELQAVVAAAGTTAQVAATALRNALFLLFFTVLSPPRRRL